MGRKKGGIPGVSFSAKRALGISQAKANFSRKTGIPLSKSARQRKAGAALGCLLPTLFLLASITLAVVL